MAQRWVFVGGILLILGLIGCSGTESTPPTAAPTIRTAAIVPTLPPTWTPVPTQTPIDTPTATYTPTLTLTPQPTETLTAAAACDQFSVTGMPKEGLNLFYADVIGFSWEGAPPDSYVILSVVKNGEETLVTFPPSVGFNALFDVRNLPGWGTYQWSLSLFLEPYGEICLQTLGTFYREPWWVKPINNPLAPPF